MRCSLSRRYGGDVVKFAGDALQVMFPVFTPSPQSAKAQATLALSVVAAVECGLHLNEFIDQMHAQADEEDGGSHPRRGLLAPIVHTSGMRSNWKRLKEAVVTHRLRSVWGGGAKKRGTGQQHMSVSLARNQGLSLYQVYTNYRKRTPAGVAPSQRRFFASPNATVPPGPLTGSSEGGGAAVTPDGGAVKVATTSQQHATSHLEGEQRLRMKVSIGTGLVLGMHTGGVGGRWEYFIAGDPMTQILEAEKVAEPGYVVLHEKVRAMRCCDALLPLPLQLLLLPPLPLMFLCVDAFRSLVSV